MFWKALLCVTFTHSFYCFAQFSSCNDFGELVECEPHTKLASTTYLITVDVDNPDNLASAFLDIWIHRRVTLWMYYVQSFFGHTCYVLHKWVVPGVNCKYVSIPLYSKETKTEDSSRLGYDTVIGRVFHDIMKDYNAFILGDKQSKSSWNTRDCSLNYTVLHPRGTLAGRTSHVAQIKTCLTLLE
jgi:hypothetical protein